MTERWLDIYTVKGDLIYNETMCESWAVSGHHGPWKSWEKAMDAFGSGYEIHIRVSDMSDAMSRVEDDQ